VDRNIERTAILFTKTRFSFAGAFVAFTQLLKVQSYHLLVTALFLWLAFGLLRRKLILHDWSDHFAELVHVVDDTIRSFLLPFVISCSRSWIEFKRLLVLVSAVLVLRFDFIIFKARQNSGPLRWLSLYDFVVFWQNILFRSCWNYRNFRYLPLILKQLTRSHLNRPSWLTFISNRVPVNNIRHLVFLARDTRVLRFIPLESSLLGLALLWRHLLRRLLLWLLAARNGLLGHNL